jgi:hypothetical protein
LQDGDHAAGQRRREAGKRVHFRVGVLTFSVPTDGPNVSELADFSNAQRRSRTHRNTSFASAETRVFRDWKTSDSATRDLHPTGFPATGHADEKTPLPLDDVRICQRQCSPGR